MDVGQTLDVTRSDTQPMGPLERRHMQSEMFRNASQSDKLTKTHWHIAWANGLGWGFDGMDGAIFGLVAPMVIKEFAVDLPTYRSGVQIAMLIGIVGVYFWPWLGDKLGRRTLLAVNIAMFSFLMPIIAIAPNFMAFVAAYGLVRFALNGEWALGSMLVAETWPAKMRGMVISVDRSAWGLGAALAGVLTVYVVANFGWRAAFLPPAVVALLAIYVRLLCPESPYWVRMQDRKNRIRAELKAGQTLSPDDRHWFSKTDKVGVRQLFLPDIRSNTLLATFVACISVVAFSTVGLWMPLFLSQQHGWTPSEYGSFFIAWSLFGTTGLWVGGWMADKFGRRQAFVFMLIEASIFMTLWVFATDKTSLWVLGLLWSWGFLGVWGPIVTYTAEMYPTRVRGVGNGFSWACGLFAGYVLWPFVAVWLRETTGSFAAAFLLIPVVMVIQAGVIWFCSPEHRGKELDAIAI